MVSIMIGIMATVPIASMRNAKVKAHEIDALGSLRMMAVAYENYNNQTRPHRYPHYLQGPQLSPPWIEYQSAEEIWDDLIALSLLPRKFAGIPHEEPNLLANGYRLSIIPFSVIPNISISPRYSYALAMIPIEGSQQPRAIAIFQGMHFGKRMVSANPRKLPGTGDFAGAKFYTWKDF